MPKHKKCEEGVMMKKQKMILHSLTLCLDPLPGLAHLPEVGSCVTRRLLIHFCLILRPFHGQAPLLLHLHHRKDAPRQVA